MIYPEQSTLSLDDLIEKKCGIGLYQVIVLSVIVFIDFNDGCELILMTFLMPILKQEWTLTTSQVSLLTQMFYIGMIFGSLLTGFISDCKGRQKCIIFGCFIQFLAANAFLFCNNSNQMIVARFIYGFVYGFTIPLTTTMISEITTIKVRGRFLIIINFFVSIGKIYAFILAYICLDNFKSGNWRLMMCLSSFTCLIVGILASIYIMESPRYLLAAGRVSEALNVLEEIAEINKRTPEVFKRIFTQIQLKVEDRPFAGSKYGYISKDEKVDIEAWARRTFRMKQGSLGELLKVENRQTTLRLWLIWFCLNFMYFGQLIILPFIFGKKDKSFSDYLISVLGELPSIVLSLMIIEIPNLGRRNTMGISYLLAAVFHFLSTTHTWPLFFTRFFMKEGWAMLYPYTTEIFQTGNRALGFGSSAAVGRLGAAISPNILFPLYELNIELPFVSFGIAAIICGAAALTLPYDTQGRLLDFQNDEIEMIPREEQANEILDILIERQIN